MSEGVLFRHRNECRVSAGRAKVAIAVAEDARDRIDEVAAACRARGLIHTSTLMEIGVLMGSAELHSLPRLRAVPGVLAVELERAYRARAQLRGVN
jgi:hypothetical protein